MVNVDRQDVLVVFVRLDFKHIKLLLLFLLLPVSTLAQGQSLILISDTKEKHIQPDTWITVSTSGSGKNPEDECFCPSWSGQLIKASKDSVTLSVYSIVRADSSDAAIRTVVHYPVKQGPSKLPNVEVAYDDITSIMINGHGKKPREFNVIGNIGKVLTVAGLAALVTSPIADNTGEVALIGSAEFVTGFILVSVGKHRRYFISENPPISLQTRTWRIKRT